MRRIWSMRDWLIPVGALVAVLVMSYFSVGAFKYYGAIEWFLAGWIAQVIVDRVRRRKKKEALVS